MAKVIFSPLISGMSGKTADAVFANWRGIYYVRQHVIPHNPKTIAQMAVRDALSECVNFWHYLPGALHDAYDRGVKGLDLSGYNSFVGRNRTVLQAQSALMGPCRNPQAIDPWIEIPSDLAYDSEPGAGTAQYTWTDPGQGPDYRMGFAIYDATLNTIGDVNMNANLMSLEAQVLSHPVVGNVYLTMFWVFRVSDSEVVHFGGTAHEQLT